MYLPKLGWWGGGGISSDLANILDPKGALNIDIYVLKFMLQNVSAKHPKDALEQQVPDSILS